MTDVHCCTVCLNPRSMHSEVCTEPECREVGKSTSWPRWTPTRAHRPAPCCPGCDCRSFEVLHPYLTPAPEGR